VNAAADVDQQRRNRSRRLVKLPLGLAGVRLVPSIID